MNACHHARTLAALTCLTLLPLSSTAIGQEAPDPAKMEEAMKKYANPGKEHRAFRALAGTWKAESTYWMGPDGPTMTSTGQSKIRVLMKGRYLSEQFSAESKEFGSFQGQGTLAYDRLAKEYIHTWIDTMGTGILISRGKPSADPGKIELHSVYKDPLTMQEIKYRMVIPLTDGPKREAEMFATYPGKEEFRSMRIIYTRVAEPAKGKKGKAATKPKPE